MAPRLEHQDAFPRSGLAAGGAVQRRVSEEVVEAPQPRPSPAARPEAPQALRSAAKMGLLSRVVAGIAA